jgi:protein tyrosine/serine phosphatase
VIDLRKDSLREAPDWVKGAGMQYFNIPLKASVPPTAEQTAYFLSLVNNPANWPVYVHCKGGRHRTGALTAVYRITQDGWTADQAFQEMKEYEFNHGLFGGPIEQKKYVYSFYERYRVKQASGQR